MKIINLEENISQEQLEYLEKVIKITEEMINTFVKEKYKDEKILTDLLTVLNNTNIYLDHKNIPDTNVAARYEGVTKSIRMGKGFTLNMQKNVLEAIGILIHELQHKFSSEISQGEKSSVLDEAFSDIFTEECMNFFLKKHPEKLEKIGIRNLPDRIVSSNAYDGENEFVKMIMEAIRQKNGRHYETECEYIFGKKEKFLDIVRETLGDGAIEIIREQQKEGHDGLGEKYNYDYNKKMEKLIEKMQLEDVKDRKSVV